MTNSGPCLFIALAATAALLRAQPAATPPPAFEVVSIKPNPVTAGTLFQEFKRRPEPVASGNRFYQKQTTLQILVMQAYGVWDYQISGLPDWARAPNGEHYEVDARAAGEATPPTDQLQLMLQSLLADRFHLRLHRETKDLSVYALTVAKGGPKLQEVPGDPRQASMIQSLVNLLSHVVDRPIVDKTGLAGGYDFAPVYTLGWAKLGEEHRADPMSIPESLTAALEEKAGLKLEPRKEPVEVLVIDQAAKPSPN
jgi:uncharacterized protein (TIGR03435 family)